MITSLRMKRRALKRARKQGGPRGSAMMSRLRHNDEDVSQRVVLPEILPNTRPFRAEDLTLEQWLEIATVVAALSPLLMRAVGPAAALMLADADDVLMYGTQQFSLKKGLTKLGKKLKPVFKGVMNSGLVSFIPGGAAIQGAYSAYQALTPQKAPKPKKGLWLPEQYEPVQENTWQQQQQQTPPMLYPGVYPSYATPPPAYPSARVYEPQFAPAHHERANRRFLEVEESFGEEEALSNLEYEFPEAAEDLYSLATYSPYFEESEAAESQSYFDKQAEAHTCMLCGARVADWQSDSTSLPLGTFYKSALVTASIVPTLGRGVYGEVVIDSFPFPLRIGGDATEARAAIALAHELAHVANKVHKLNLNHDQVHALGVFYSTEGFPLYRAFLSRTQSSS